MRNVAVLAVLPIFLAALGACVTYQAIPVTELAEGVAPGNRVIVTTYAGNELRFKVQSIDLDARAVVGEDVRVSFDDVALVERKRYLWSRTAGAFGTTALVLGGLLILAILVTFG